MCPPGCVATWLGLGLGSGSGLGSGLGLGLGLGFGLEVGHDGAAVEEVREAHRAFGRHERVCRAWLGFTSGLGLGCEGEVTLTLTQIRARLSCR